MTTVFYKLSALCVLQITVLLGIWIQQTKYLQKYSLASSIKNSPAIAKPPKGSFEYENIQRITGVYLIKPYSNTLFYRMKLTTNASEPIMHALIEYCFVLIVIQNIMLLTESVHNNNGEFNILQTSNSFWALSTYILTVSSHSFWSLQ